MKKFNLPLANAHCHSAMVAFRGMAEDLSLKNWLEDYIWPLEAKFVNPDFIYENTKKSILEMRNNGIRLVNDNYFYPEFIAKAAIEMKMNYVLGVPIINFPSPGAINGEQGLRLSEELILKYQNNEFVKVAVTPHSIYAVSKELLIQAKLLSDKYQTIFHIHLAESKEEFDNCMRDNGCTPTQYLYNLGILNERCVLAHCVWLTDEDIDILSLTRANVAHCPLSNLKLGSGIAPIAKMIEKGVNVCLGTDGAASSNRLDIWEAGKFAGLLQKGITNNPEVLPTKQIIKMMTINGMRALGFDKLDGKTIEEIEIFIDSEKDFNYLYELNIGEI